jgi:squalene synthase HpnC
VTVTAAPAFPASDRIRRRARGENFDVASLVLGGRARTLLLAIYDVARLVDELGDTVDGDRHAALDEAEAELERAYTGTPRTDVFRGLAAALALAPLPREAFARLIEANRRDQRQHDYATFDDLVDYCTLSANPVGELVLAAFDASTPERVALSDDVCTALQVIEHVQDVREDALAGRIYMPRDDRDRFGVEPADLTADLATPALRELVAFECDRAAALLRSGIPLVASLQPRARIAVAGYVGGGLATLAAIRRTGHDVLRDTPKATRAAKVAATLRVLGSAR